MDPVLKDKLNTLNTWSKERDILNIEIDRTRKELVPLIKQNALTNTKFDYGDRYLRYRVYNEYGQISQKVLRQVLQAKYPEINADNFINEVLSQRKLTRKETVEIVKTKS